VDNDEKASFQSAIEVISSWQSRLTKFSPFQIARATVLRRNKDKSKIMQV